MKTARKALAIALCAILLVGASVMGTLAYLTADAGDVTNTFTVGNITMDGNGLDEAKVDVYGVPEEGADRVKANTYKLVPGHEYVKDPTVHLSNGNEACYVFISVKNEIAAIEANNNNKIANQIVANDWTQYTDAEGKPVAGIYYKDVAADDMADKVLDLVVFDKFTVADDADVSDYADKTIVIQACAVQRDGLTVAQAYAEATKYIAIA